MACSGGYVRRVFRHLCVYLLAYWTHILLKKAFGDPPQPMACQPKTYVRRRFDRFYECIVGGDKVAGGQVYSLECVVFSYKIRRKMLNKSTICRIFIICPLSTSKQAKSLIMGMLLPRIKNSKSRQFWSWGDIGTPSSNTNQHRGLYIRYTARHGLFSTTLEDLVKSWPLLQMFAFSPPFSLTVGPSWARSSLHRSCPSWSRSLRQRVRVSSGMTSKSPF